MNTINTIITNKQSGKDYKHAIKLYNVESQSEGWQYIHEFAKKFCQLKGYSEYGIDEFYEGDENGIVRNYASVVFLYDNELKEALTFDVDNFMEVHTYTEFTFFKV